MTPFAVGINNVQTAMGGDLVASNDFIRAGSYADDGWSQEAVLIAWLEASPFDRSVAEVRAYILVRVWPKQTMRMGIRLVPFIAQKYSNRRAMGFEYRITKGGPASWQTLMDQAAFIAF